MNGFLGGLVAITCPCYWVEPVGAFFIGVIASVVLVLAVEALEYFRIDDPIGAVPVHMANGIWGTLALGLFASGKYFLPTPTGADVSAPVIGLFYGGGATQLVSQIIGSFSVTAATLIVSTVLMLAVNATRTLRVSAEGELIGLDIHEHGAIAYPEYSIVHSSRNPMSMAGAKVKTARSDVTGAASPVAK